MGGCHCAGLLVHFAALRAAVSACCWLCVLLVCGGVARIALLAAQLWGPAADLKRWQHAAQCMLCRWQAVMCCCLSQAGVQAAIGCCLPAPPPPSRRIKEQVFGATTFWVTETRPLATQSLELGVVVKGNL